MSLARLALVLACGVIAGVALRSVYVFDTYFVLAITFLAGMLFVLAIRAPYDGARIFYVAFFLCALCIGVLRADSVFTTKDSLGVFVGQDITRTGIVVHAPERRSESLHVVVSVSDAPHEYIILYADRLTDISYGDTVSFSGQLERPESFADNTGTRVFNYPAYLAKDGIRYRMLRPTIAVQERYTGISFFAFLYSSKDVFYTAIFRMLPEPHASLAGGITIGERQALTEYWKNVFVTTGLIHIVVLSGYNITLVANSVLFLLSSFTARRTVHFMVGACIVCCFVLLTGASSTGVRAGIMAIIAMLAVHTHRDFNGFRALGFAGTVMVLWNPYVLMFDPSFQLSVIATFGLMYATEFFAPYTTWVPDVFQLPEIVASTLATFVWVLPFLLYLTGNLSFIALPVNFIVLPVVPLAMSAVFVGVFATFVMPALAVMWGAASYVLLEYVLTVSELGARIPYASTTIPAFSLWWVILAYVLLFLIMSRVQTDPVQHSN